MEKLKVQGLYNKMEITNRKVHEKTEELVRLLDYHAPRGIRAGANACRYAVCLHLACLLHKPEPEPFDREIACRVCGVDIPTYCEAKVQVMAVLKITIPVNLKQVAKELGLPLAVPELATKVLKRYKELFLSSLTKERQEQVSFNSSAYPAACLMLCAEFKNVKIDKTKLLELTDTRLKDFTTSYDSIDEIIFQPMKKKEQLATEQLEKDKPKAPKKRGQKASQTIKTPPKRPSALNSVLTIPLPDASTDQFELEIYGEDEKGQPVLPPALKKQKQREEFQQFKEKALREPKIVGLVLGRTKQTTLNFQATKEATANSEEPSDNDEKNIPGEMDRTETDQDEAPVSTKRKRSLEMESSNKKIRI